MDYLSYSDFMIYYKVDCSIVTNSQSKERWFIRSHKFLDVYTNPLSEGVILEAHLSILDLLLLFRVQQTQL